MTEREVTAPSRIVLATGPSGAGRSTAARALEDMGFESIDNMPLSLLPRLLDGRPLERPLVLGIDTRTRGFSVPALLDAAAAIRESGSYDTTLLYLDARPEVLLRRFSETRRRHPVSGSEAPAVGVERELTLLLPLREQADILIDTSDLSPHDLRAALARWFGGGAGTALAVSVQSFSYKRGLPQDLDCIFDVRFLANPHWEETLRPLDGRDQRVSDFVARDPRFGAFFGRLANLLAETLPAYRDEGKAYFSVGFGCTGGRHRSVATAEKMANALADAGWRVSIRHRELERSGTKDPGDGAAETEKA